MTDQQNPSSEIAGVIDTLPQAGGEPQETRKRTYTKRRRRKNARKDATARDALQLNIPSSDEEPRSRMFLTTVANLALLVAVLTIVFAAHRAVQNRQQTTDNRPKTLDQTTQTTEQASEPQVTAESSEPTELTQQVELAEPTRPTEQPEQVQEIQPVKQAKPVDRFSSDPYTNSGPLDLDRRGGTQATPTLPRARSATMADSKNPWNSGGHMDLDSETNRQQYKKALSLAE